MYNGYPMNSVWQNSESSHAPHSSNSQASSVFSLLKITLLLDVHVIFRTIYLSVGYFGGA